MVAGAALVEVCCNWSFAANAGFPFQFAATAWAWARIYAGWLHGVLYFHREIRGEGQFGFNAV
jgi:hypothetical protein